MARRRAKFRRYRGEGTQWVPRSQLSTVTRRNLGYLELEHGFRFDDRAKKATFGHSPSYLIYGVSPGGEDIVFERRETTSKMSGQTYVWVEGKRHRLKEFDLPLEGVQGVRSRLAAPTLAPMSQAHYEDYKEQAAEREHYLDSLATELGFEGGEPYGHRGALHGVLWMLDKSPELHGFSRAPTYGDLPLEVRQHILEETKPLREEYRVYERGFPKEEE